MNIRYFCFRCITCHLQRCFDEQLVAAGKNRGNDWSFVKNALACFSFIDEPSYFKGRGCALMRVRCTEHGRNSIASLWDMFKFLMRSIEELHLRDPSIVAYILHRMHYFTQKCESNSVFPMYAKYHCLCRSGRCRKSVLTLPEFQQLLKMPYYELPHQPPQPGTVVDLYCHSHVVWAAVEKGEEFVVSSLLRNGVIFLPATIYRYSSGMQLYHDMKYLLDNEDWLPSLRTKLSIGKLFSRVNGPTSTRRKYFVLRNLKLLGLELKRRSQDIKPKRRKRVDTNEGRVSRSSSPYFHCLRKAFETIPEPFVSSIEVKRFFYVLYSPDWDESTEHRIDAITDMYKELYPESIPPPGPRSLKHLSRCKLRECLRQSCALPHGVAALRIPTSLKKYILLE